MASYGYLIIRNPGPETEIEFGGLVGYQDGNFDDPHAAEREARTKAGPDDQVHVLVVFDADDTGSELQLEAYDSAEEVENS